MALYPDLQLRTLARKELNTRLGIDDAQVSKILNSDKQLDYANALAALMPDVQYNRLPRVTLYPHQMRIWEETLDSPNSEPRFRRLKDFTIVQGVIASNRSGKTYSTCYALACHLTGIYPSWWPDVKYKTGVRVIAGGASSDQLKEAFCETLFGTIDKRYQDAMGTGLIPRANLILDSAISGATADLVKSIRIKHKSGTESVISFISYNQERDVLQGGKTDIIALDEQPDDDSLVSEVLRAMAQTPSGQEPRVYVSFTPLRGRAPNSLVDKFLTGAPGYSYVRYTWDDLPEELLPQKTKETLLATFLPWEIPARTQGIPAQGEGAVFQVNLQDCLYDPADFPLKERYKLIAGIDFGRSPDPTAIVWCAWDRDNDIVFIYDCHRAANQTPLEYHAALVARNKSIPLAYPRDGKRKGYTETSSVVDELRYTYEINLLPEPFTNPDGGNSIDYGLQWMLQRLRTNRLKISRHLVPLIREMENYHTDRSGPFGKLAFRGSDHFIDAARYALMSMDRFGQSKQDTTLQDDALIRHQQDKKYLSSFYMNQY